MSRAETANELRQTRPANDGPTLLYDRDQTCSGVRKTQPSGQANGLRQIKRFAKNRIRYNHRNLYELLNVARRIFFISIDDFPNERVTYNICRKEFDLFNPFDATQDT